MSVETRIQVFNISINSENLRIDARELYNFLEIDINFNKWIDGLVRNFKDYNDFIVIKEPAVGIKTKPVFVYYLSLKVAKVAALQAGSEKGEIAYNYFREIS